MKSSMRFRNLLRLGDFEDLTKVTAPLPVIYGCFGTGQQILNRLELKLVEAAGQYKELVRSVSFRLPDPPKSGPPPRR